MDYAVLIPDRMSKKRLIEGRDGGDDSMMRSFLILRRQIEWRGIKNA